MAGQSDVSYREVVYSSQAGKIVEGTGLPFEPVPEQGYAKPVRWEHLIGPAPNQTAQP